MGQIIPDTGDHMARKGNYHAGQPKGFTPGAPPEAVKAEFGRVLQRHLVNKSWNQSDLAREAAKHMPDKKFPRDNVSQYIRGLTLPGPVRLKALGKALGVKPEDLLPVRSSETIDQKAPPLAINSLGGGTSWIRVNQAVTDKTALKIMQLLEEDPTDGK